MRTLYTIILMVGLFASATVKAQAPSMLQNMGRYGTLTAFHQEGGLTYYGVIGNAGGYLWANYGTYAVQLAFFPGKEITAFPRIPGRSEFYFLIGNSNNTDALWRTDGTISGTVQVETLNRRVMRNDYIVLNNRIFCATIDANLPSNRCGFMVTDGSINGATYVDSLVSLPKDMHIVPGSGMVTFSQQIPNSAYQVWQTDGTQAGTQLHPYLPTTPNLADFGGMFQGKGMYALGQEVWTSDGTAAGTALLKQFQGSDVPIFEDIEHDPNAFYFFSYDGSQFKAGFWKTDGTAANTLNVADFTNSYGYYRVQRINGEFFMAQLGANGAYDIYHSDGTSSGSKLMGTIIWEIPYEVYEIGNPPRYYFGALRGDNMFNFWTINLQQDTLELMNAYGLRNNIPFSLETSQGELHYFFNEDIAPPFTNNIWVTDGTATGMQMLHQYPDNSPPVFFSFAGRDSAYYFLRDSTNHLELWRIGTSPGTPDLVTTFGDSTASLLSTTVVFDRGNWYFTSTFMGGYNFQMVGVTDGRPGGSQIFPHRFENVTGWHQRYYGSDSTQYFFARTLTDSLQLWTFGDVVTGLEPSVEQGEALIYPNPGSAARLRVPAEWLQSGDGQYTISDVQGRTVAIGAVRQEEQALPNRELPSGMYLISVSAGGHHWSGKWIKTAEQ